MSKLADIRAAIKAKIELITDIGQVHDYERFAKAEKDMKALYESQEGTDKLIAGWYLRRMGFTQTKINQRYEITNRWRIVGFRSLNDAAGSEKIFDEKIELLTEEFRLDNNLGGVVNSLTDGERSGLQLDDSGPLMFAGVLCHGARLSINTTHII